VIAAHGSRSRPHHRESARELAGKAPQGELVVLEGAEHGAHLSDPTAFAALVRRAIARTAPGP
jgi:pimeloyl-ACP methyl ester carboxylesterase